MGVLSKSNNWSANVNLQHVVHTLQLQDKKYTRNNLEHCGEEEVDIVTGDSSVSHMLWCSVPIFLHFDAFYEWGDSYETELEK